MNIVILCIAGLLSGICASMGLGGGFVLLLYLTLFTAVPQLEAQMMNLIFFLPIAILSIIIHRKHHLIEKKVVWKAVLFGIAGVLIGTWLSRFINADLLSKLFGGFVLFVGLKELFHKKKIKNVKIS